MNKIKLTFLALVGLASCGLQDGTSTQGVEQGPVAAETATHAALNLKLSVVDETGAQQELNRFELKTDVFLSLAIADATKSVLAQDFVFQVIDANGRVLSSDDLACRQFHVTAEGRIDAVHTGIDAAGAECVHLFVRADDGRILINLAPFEDALADGNGAMRFTLKVAALATCGDDQKFDDATTLPFVVQPADEEDHTCGCGNGVVDDGEACDDGNHTDGDGCDHECAAEPRCGDGVVDAGEQCDDGNTDDGDACHNDCTPCAESTPPPAPVCGDGNVDDGEQCDDGNSVDHGDGCHNDCTVCAGHDDGDDDDHDDDDHGHD